MGKDIAESSPVARQFFDLADQILGMNLSRLCFEGPEEQLTRTSNAQPAILVTSIATLNAAIESGAVDKRPTLMAGHSLGEYTALVAAAALSFEDALLLVAERGRLMERASIEQPGTMAAVVGLSEDDIIEICRLSGAEVCNYNSSTQIVVGGTLTAVKSACQLAKEKGGRGLPLNVSGAFHTSLMESASREFAAAFEPITVGDPTIPVVGNVTATPLRNTTEVLSDLTQQIGRPVLWHQSITYMTESGVDTVVEIGPGRTLSAILKRSYPELTSIAIDGVAAMASPSNV